MLTKEMFEIATRIDDLYAIYMGSSTDESRDIAFKLYEMCNGNLDYMEKTLDLAIENFVNEENIIKFFNDAINGTEIDIDELGQYLGYVDPRD